VSAPVVALLVVAVLLVLAAVVWALTATAARLDRLHHRVETSRASLDARLLRRASAAEQLALSGLLDPASALLLASAAGEALGAEGEAERSGAESDLTRALRAALPPATVAALRRGPTGTRLLDDLDAACQRAVLARRFANDAVAQTVRVRRTRVVRWGRLAGHAALPRSFDADDEPPALAAEHVLPRPGGPR